jgi:hypothetical protein
LKNEFWNVFCLWIEPVSIEGLIASLVLIGLAALYIALPLLRSDKRKMSDASLQKQSERLLVYYERVLTNLRDLDEDHLTGKITVDEYQAEREEWMQRGVQVLKALDHLAEQQIVSDTRLLDEADIDQAVDDAIEAAIARRRAMVSADETS